MSSSKRDDESNFHDAIQTLLSMPLERDEAMLDSLTTIEAYLRQSQVNDGEEREPLRDVLSPSISISHQWERLMAILTFGMEQRRCYDSDDAGLSQEMTQETWPSSYADNESSNLMTSSKISLVPTSLVAATAYAQLLSHRGALAVGIVSMDAVAALANVINRWKVECCAYKKAKGKGAKVTKQVIRRKGNASQNTNTTDTEEVLEFESLPVKRSRRTGSSNTQIMADFLDSDNDDEIPNKITEELCPLNLIALGLPMAQAVCQIPLQPEFSNSWNMEAIEIIISCVTILTATLQALISKGLREDEVAMVGLHQKVSAIIEIATTGLTSSILVPEDLQVDEENNVGDDASDYDDKDVVSSIKNLSRRHDITVATLRALFPLLSMKDILPMGESGKGAAAQLASTLLENIIQEIHTDIQIHPNRWPKQTNANRRSSFASTVPSTHPSSTAPGSIDTPTSPKQIVKHLRATPNGQNGLIGPKGRNSMTPKVKTKTPMTAMETPMTQYTFRPGPVLSALIGVLQQISTMPGLESAGLRTCAVRTIHRCVKLFPLSEQTCFLQFLVKLCHSKLPVHRLVASELIGDMLSEDWIWTTDGTWKSDWDQLATSFGVMSPYTPDRRNQSVSSKRPMKSPTNASETLFGALKGRLADRTPTIRCISASGITNLCRRVLSSESLSSTSRTEFLHVLSDHLYELLEILRDRSVSDDKATVRRAACIALVDVLLIGILIDDEDLVPCSITEQDVTVLSTACQDTSLMVRRAAADGLTSLIEHVTQSSGGAVSRTLLQSMEIAWTASTIPMVLDSESSCANKAIELVERLLIFPVVTTPEKMSTKHSNMAKATSWRILASLGVRASSGSSRSETDALCKAIQQCIVLNLGKGNHHYAEAIFRTIHETAINSIDPDKGDLFEPANAHQRAGVWCLFMAVIGKGVIPMDIIRSLKKCKIDMTFLCASWDKLLHLFLTRESSQDCKAALQHSMRCCLHILSQLAMLVDCATAEHTTSKLQHLLGNFLLPPDIIGASIDAMIATCIASRKDVSQNEHYKYCKDLLNSIYKSCETSLSTPHFDVEGTSRVARILFTVGEISIVGFSASDDGTDSYSKTDSTNAKKNMATSTFVRGICERPSNQLIEYVQAFMTDSLPVGLCNSIESTPLSIRAHAFVALGKLCLRDANLAKQSLNVLARELHNSIQSENRAVQSNALIVLGDLCVKYTNMVDRFLPVMAGCLQAGTVGAARSPSDGSSLVRKHAILLLSSLILQDYVKWRGLLFHRFLVASVDDNNEVACLAEMVLFGPLLSKQPRLFANQFVESLFVLNCCTDHPIFKAAVALGDGGSGISVGFDGISLKGDTGRIKRMQMYQMMLSKMSDEDKIGVTARIGKEVLGGALKGGSELNIAATAATSAHISNQSYDSAFNVLSDALSVLKCPQIRVGRVNRGADDDVEDPNVSTNNMKRVLVAKGRLLSNVSRKHLIEILMPILCNLKSILEKSRSPLLKDLMICLLDVYQRHKSEARECLANDPTTLQEIEYDAQQQLKVQKKISLGHPHSIHNQ